MTAEKASRKNRLRLLLLVVIMVTAVGVAYILYFQPQFGNNIPREVAAQIKPAASNGQVNTQLKKKLTEDEQIDLRVSNVALAVTPTVNPDAHASENKPATVDEKVDAPLTSADVNESAVENLEPIKPPTTPEPAVLASEPGIGSSTPDKNPGGEEQKTAAVSIKPLEPEAVKNDASDKKEAIKPEQKPQPVKDEMPVVEPIKTAAVSVKPSEPETVKQDPSDIKEVLKPEPAPEPGKKEKPTDKPIKTAALSVKPPEPETVKPDASDKTESIKPEPTPQPIKDEKPAAKITIDPESPAHDTSLFERPEFQVAAARTKKNDKLNKWVVNVLSTQDGKKARQVLDALVNIPHHVYAYTTKVKGKDYIRIRVGFFDTKKEAEAVGAKLRKQHKLPKPWLVKPGPEELSKYYDRKTLTEKLK